jgi:hypothetical protein
MFECKRKAVESYRQDPTQNFRCIAKKMDVHTNGIRFMGMENKPNAQKPKERRAEK